MSWRVAGWTRLVDGQAWLRQDEKEIWLFDRMNPGRRRLAALAAAILLAPGTEAAMPAPLQRYVGKSRVLLVFAPGEDNPTLAEQRRIMASAAQGAGQRELVVVEIVGTRVSGPAMSTDDGPNALRRRFGVPPAAFRAVLVGKDGGAKLLEAAPIEADRLFAVVDAMPMRQREIAPSQVADQISIALADASAASPAIPKTEK
jgi:hypothetical protein